MRGFENFLEVFAEVFKEVFLGGFENLSEVFVGGFENLLEVFREVLKTSRKFSERF